MTPLAGHTNSYHPYAAEQAYTGLAAAGYRAVELSAVPGWTEHVDVHGDSAEVRAMPMSRRARARSWPTSARSPTPRRRPASSSRSRSTAT